MCHRISPLLIAELRAAVEEMRTTGRPRVPKRKADVVVPDVYPGKQLPLFVLNDVGGLEAVELTWGFDAVVGGKQKLVFNTRIETALAQARSGNGMWARPVLEGRCLVPVRAFYESWTREPPRRGAQVRFTMPGRQTFLLAGIWQDDRCSVVTTVPNASVGAVHSRMPLVLGPGESSIWLGPDFAQLADRRSILLDAQADEPAEPALF